MLRARAFALFALFITFAAAANSVWAGAGDLDPSFGTNGVVSTNVGFNAVTIGVAVAPGGKIITATKADTGSAFTRLNADGSADTNFGTMNNGVVTTTAFVVKGMAVQTDGKVVAVGGTTLARYDTTGSLDNTFGTGGLVQGASSTAVALQSDGEIVVAGENGGNFEIRRYDTGGNLDPAFGTNGVLDIAGSGPPQNEEILIEPDGKILVGGFASPFVILARCDSGGNLDSSFGTNGVVQIDSSTLDPPAVFAVESSGEIVIALRSPSFTSLDLLASNGTLDTIQYDTCGNVNALLVELSDQLIAVGGSIARFDAAGNLDSTFGTSGCSTADGQGGLAYAVALQSGDELLVGGGTPGTPSLVRLFDGDCGNGTAEPGEECDDGNNDDNDACKNDCTLNTCGDGVVYTGVEACDDGPLNGTTSSCCTAACAISPDSDGDGVCDAEDICTNVGDAQDFAAKPPPKIIIGNITVVGIDTLKLSGEFALAGAPPFSTVDPQTNGARVVVENHLGQIRIDAQLPAGAYAGKNTRGWVVNKSGKTWTYHDATTTPIEGLTKLVITDASKKSPGLVHVTASGKKATYPIISTDDPLYAVVVLGGPEQAAAGQCGEVAFQAGECSLNASFNKITCRQ